MLCSSVAAYHMYGVCTVRCLECESYSTQRTAQMKAPWWWS